MGKTVLDQTGTKHDRMEKKNLQSLSEFDKAYDFDFMNQSTAAVKRRDPKMIDSYFHGTPVATNGHHPDRSPPQNKNQKGEKNKSDNQRERRHTKA